MPHLGHILYDQNARIQQHEHFTGELIVVQTVEQNNWTSVCENAASHLCRAL